MGKRFGKKVELPKLPESTNNDRGTTIKFKTQVNFNTNLC